MTATPRIRSKPWLNRFAWFTAIATLFLICSGGMVTSKGVGLAVPDWPTTFGYNMFLFPVSKWIGGIFFEHTHRLIASTVGFLTIILAIWLWRREERQWLRSLGLIALAFVILQGVLGGLRVTMLRDEIGILHACLAQAFLGLVVVIALATTKFWRTLSNIVVDSEKLGPIKTIAIAITIGIYIQLALGATMRHQHRDLAILDFPTAYGAWLPDTSEYKLALINAWRNAHGFSEVSGFQIWLQMAHRFLALVIAVAVIAFWARIGRDARKITALRRLSILWVVLIFVQLTLGAWTIWSNKAADIATAHVAMGALMLSLGVSVSAVCWRILQNEASEGSTDCIDGGKAVERMKMAAMQSEIPSVAANDERSRARGAGDFVQLVKARLTLLVLLTTAVGFYLAAPSPTNYVGFFHVVFGTALAAASAAALNQWWERGADALMHRTKTRPIPAGRMSPRDAFVIGTLLAAAGIIYLALVCNALTAFLAGLTIVLYIFAYTPLKRISTANTLVGAIPGAIPPMIGWAAARGEVNAGAWSLFAILFFWQMPHFFALAWMYRADYARAGFQMISSDDETGARSSSQSVLFCLLLLVVGGVPAYLGLTNAIYVPIAFALGGFFIAVAMQFHRRRTTRDARRLFIMSIIYLPLLLLALVVTKL